VNAASIITKGQQHIETVADGEVVLMHVESGRFFTLSGTGRRVWELMAEPVAIGTLIEQLSREFAVDRDTCLGDVVELCQRLEAGGLIDVAP
jgi:hypothetical protein